MTRCILPLLIALCLALPCTSVSAQTQFVSAESSAFADNLFVPPADDDLRVGPLFAAWGDSEPSDGEDEPEPIATDRPDFTESSTTVGAGVAQIEMGYTLTRQADKNVRSHSWGEPLLRVGVYADWLELRAALAPTTDVVDAPGLNSRESGVEDIYLGLKLGLTAQSGWLPELAVVPQMTIPTGTNNFSTGQTLPGCNLLYGWDVTESISTAGSTQVNMAVDGDNTYAEWAQSWTVGLSLAENVGLYSEWFAIVPDQTTNIATEHYVNGGVTYRLTDDIQFDARAGTGLNEDAADFFGGIGLSLRFR